MSNPPPSYKQILSQASAVLKHYSGRELEIIEVKPPPDLDYALHLSKIVSKLSPIIGNLLEYDIVRFLNENESYPNGRWKRQDPGFPDTIFDGDIQPTPGIEIKTWFPLATEITARFKDSVTHFEAEQTNVAMLAWVPQYIIFGRPRIIDIWLDTADSVAKARDLHYHRPPDYLVFEPEDTSARTINLQQTNVNGYKFQGTETELAEAQKEVASWGPDATTYSSDPEYQTRLQSLLGRYRYRLDTNFAKMDRIEHASLEAFKQKVLATRISERSILDWSQVIRGSDSPTNKGIIQQLISPPE